MNKRIIFSISIVIILLLASILYICCQPKEKWYSYSYELEIINTSSDDEYHLIVPMPHNWADMQNDQKSSQGIFHYSTNGNIDGNPAIDLYGTGDIYFKCSLNTTPCSISFSWIWNGSGLAKVYAELPLGLTSIIKINYDEHRTNTGESYNLNGGLTQSGWNQIKVKATMA